MFLIEFERLYSKWVWFGSGSEVQTLGDDSNSRQKFQSPISKTFEWTLKFFRQSKFLMLFLVWNLKFFCQISSIFREDNFLLYLPDFCLEFYVNWEKRLIVSVEKRGLHSYFKRISSKFFLKSHCVIPQSNEKYKLFQYFSWNWNPFALMFCNNFAYMNIFMQTISLSIIPDFLSNSWNICAKEWKNKTFYNEI